MLNCRVPNKQKPSTILSNIRYRAIGWESCFQDKKKNQHTNKIAFQRNAITVYGSHLYNSLPKYLRYIESVKTDKFKL